MKENKVKTCHFCKEPFTPDPRVGDRQKVCGKLRCQQERKRRAQQEWVKKNPGYFKGRYPELKEKILRRQQLLKASSQENSRPSLKALATIQDELTINNNSILTIFGETLAIQDEITAKILVVNKKLHQLESTLYKTSQPLVFSLG